MEPEKTKTEAPTVTPTVAVAAVVPATPAKKLPPQRHFLILFFFSFMWGSFGVDRFYMGFIGTGILKLVTFGGFGIWALTDMIVVMTGAFRDKQGRLTLQAEEYRKFASRTVFWFAVILGLFILINGALLIFEVTNLIGSFQDGSITSQIPGLDALKGGGDQEQINSLLSQ